MLSCNEESFQAHWWGGCRAISVAGSARGRDLDIGAALDLAADYFSFSVFERRLIFAGLYRLPPLGRRSPSPRHILCNAGLSDTDAELEKLAMNPWCAPQWVGETDLANELTDFQRGLWTATARF